MTSLLSVCWACVGMMCKLTSYWNEENGGEGAQEEKHDLSGMPRFQGMRKSESFLQV